MKIRLLSLLPLLCTLVLASGCKKDDGELVQNFTIESGDAEFDGSSLSFNGARKTVAIEVATDDATGKWDARCPTDDLWLTFSKKQGTLNVTVAENTTDKVRNSDITILLGSTSKVIRVTQDYLRSMRFAADTYPVGATAGQYSIALNTNVLPANLSFSMVPADSPVLTDISFEEGMVHFKVTKNSFDTQTRTVTLVASGDGETAELAITQNPASGKPYIIPLTALGDYDFANGYIYEVWDETTIPNKKLGLVCREYLFKAASSSDITLRTVGVVAYPYDANGKVDHSNGLVIARLHHETNALTPDGGSLMWTTGITYLTAGKDMISAYAPGTATVMPTNIYLHPGGSSFTLTALDAEDQAAAITATLKPWIVTDTRTGVANNAGQTTETFTYKVVKIGTQYWFAENLKTTRLRDGSPIATNLDNTAYAVYTTNVEPRCCVYGYPEGVASTSANRLTFNDANAADAAETRSRIGVMYNMYSGPNLSLDGTTIKNAYTGTIADAISPAGWKMPLEADFVILRNYVTQLSANAATDQLIELHTAEDAAQFGNVTRFSGVGRVMRSNSGGTNSSNGSCYASLSYSFTGTAGSGTGRQHQFKALHTGSEGSGYTANPESFDPIRGIYIRCLKAE